MTAARHDTTKKNFEGAVGSLSHLNKSTSSMRMGFCHQRVKANPATIPSIARAPRKMVTGVSAAALLLCVGNGDDVLVVEAADGVVLVLAIASVIGGNETIEADGVAIYMKS